MIKQILQRASSYAPRGIRVWGRNLFYSGRNPIHPALKKFGTVQDLYYWAADSESDTVLLLQNYFSAFYPRLNTETGGTISLFDKDGQPIGSSTFRLPAHGGAKYRVSSLLEQAGTRFGNKFGSLEVKIDIPKAVREHINGEKGLYFWDRFYIGYSNQRGQFCFVHGVDKTHIYSEGQSSAGFWYETPKGEAWAPEIPVEMDNYTKFSVVMLNRTTVDSETTLILSDAEDKELRWSVNIPAQGVHRFDLTPEDTQSLNPNEIRMMVTGMATQYGRPLVIKEFSNGAMSAMHC
jgi:hypothetical protein